VNASLLVKLLFFRLILDEIVEVQIMAGSLWFARNAVQNILKSKGINPEEAVNLGDDLILELGFEVEKQITLLNEIQYQVSHIQTNETDTRHNSNTIKTEEIFSRIDLAQARISKDQEEIQSLAKETDDLLNQLESMAS
jgi:DUF1009 family protein